MTREEEILNEICARLRSCADELRGYRVFLFGSRAANRAQSRSDFDIGIAGPLALPLKTFYKLEDALDDIPTLYEIELVDMNRVSLAFRTEAMKTMKILYE
ncbi:MAG: nucleotidyltransferase domain-containing protein [bacterium]|nr:nucleotidyltransferase domain-containing protein [bacterium]